MKRLAFYAHYDPLGDVRNYVVYCLKALQEVVDDIVFIVNGSINYNSRKKLENLGITILVRDNIGYDFGAWKAGIEYFSYEKLLTYDEFLLTNNTYYGPFYPFSEMWKKMDDIECDFWGINRHRQTNIQLISNDKSSNMLEHIQSYWIVFRKKLLCSLDFKNYWRELKTFNTYLEVVAYGESKLTNYFECRGYKSACYMDFTKYDTLYNGNPCFLTDIQVIEDRCPIAKRKFFANYEYKDAILKFRADYGSKRLIDFLHKTELYDTDLIYEDLLKSRSMSTINDSLNMNFILSTTSSEKQSIKSKVAIIFYIYPADLVSTFRGYVDCVPSEIDIIIVNTSKEVQDKCKLAFANVENKILYRLQENRGRDNTALLITCKDIINNYEYLCFIHSKKSEYFSNKYQGIYFREHNVLSLIYNKCYIYNILSLLENNKYLGLLCPFIPNTTSFKNIISDRWTCNFENAKNFLNDVLHINIDIDPWILGPFGNMFWCRTKALKSLISKNWKFEDFPVEPLQKSDGLLTHTIERITSILAQHDGYLTAWVAPDLYAQTLLNNFYYMYRCSPLANSSNYIDNNLFLVRDLYNFNSLKLKYVRYKFLSKITGGLTRIHYLKKREIYKQRINLVKGVLRKL